jgi:hypothetical protein
MGRDEAAVPRGLHLQQCTSLLADVDANTNTGF